MNTAAMRSDPLLVRTFGGDLPLLIEAFRECEACHLDHDDDEDGSYDGIVDLDVDILARILGCTRDDAWRRASDCDRALRDAFGLKLWRGGGKASAARLRGRLRVSRTIERMSRWGGPLQRSYWHGDTAGLPTGCVHELAGHLDEIADAARRGETRHFLFRVTDRGTRHDEWIDYLALDAELRHRHPQLDVRSAPADSSGDRLMRRPGNAALASIMVGEAQAVRMLPSVAPLLGGDHALATWTGDGRSHRLPPTADDADRLGAIKRFQRTFDALRGVHVWCCPASTRPPIPLREETGPAFLPELGTFNGLYAVFEPTYAAQAALQAHEDGWDEDRRREWARDFRELTELVYRKEA